MTSKEVLNMPLLEVIPTKETPADYIYDEIRGAEGSRLMRRLAIELSAIYKSSSLAKNCNTFAVSLVNARMLTPGYASESKTEPAHFVASTLYVGSLLAIHAMLQPLDKTVRQLVLNHAPEPNPSLPEDMAKEHPEALKYLGSVLDCSDELPEAYANLPDNTREAVHAAGEAIFGRQDLVRRNEYCYNFEIGYTYAAEMIRESLEEMLESTSP